MSRSPGPRDPRALRLPARKRLQVGCLPFAEIQENCSCGDLFVTACTRFIVASKELNVPNPCPASRQFPHYSYRQVAGQVSAFAVSSAFCSYSSNDGNFISARFAYARCTALLLCPKFSIANRSG